jgi:hypothetical protein
VKTVHQSDYPFPDRSDITRIEEGWMSPDALLDLPGGSGEHILFGYRPHGRLKPNQFQALVDSIRRRGYVPDYPVTIFVESDGRKYVHEGNHRLRAAALARREVFVEVRYLGGAERRHAFSAMAPTGTG